jgi:ribosomal protein S18 acetylase RimI-like enzyme
VRRGAVGDHVGVITIDAATIDDVDEVVDLWNREGGPTSHAGQRAEALALLRWNPEALLVARHGVRLVGTLIVGWDGWRCHLYRLVVEPHDRRSGVARDLVAEARRRAKASGAVKIDAMVESGNAPAVAFWAAAGFDQDTSDRRWSLFL